MGSCEWSVRMRVISEAEIAWMAGLFDGEGSIVFRGVNTVSLMLQMTDKDIVETWQERAGCGQVKIYYDKRATDRKTLYYWQASHKDDVSRLLLMMIPWLGERRKAKSMEAIERLKSNRGNPAFKKTQNV